MNQNEEGILMSEFRWKTKAFEALSKETLYQILQLRQQVFVVEQNCPYLDLDGQDQQAIYLFVEANEQVIGSIRVLPPTAERDTARLGRLVVHPQYRRARLATETMQRAMAYLHQHLPNHPVELSAQCYLLDFYRQFGFKEIGYEYLEDNIPHHDMRWEAS